MFVMQGFTIKVLEQLTRIKAQTLRGWLKRYPVNQPPAQQGVKRFFSKEEVYKLLCLAFLHYNGYDISKMAPLSDEALVEEEARIGLKDDNYPTFILKLLRAAMEFDEAGFVSILDVLAKKIGFERMITGVCYPYLNKVGLLWDRHPLLPEQEYFSLHIIQNRVIRETEIFSAMQTGEPEILLFCPQYETRTLPLLFINYLLRKNGWRVLYLGVDISVQDLKKVTVLPKVQYLYLHLISGFGGISIDDYFATLRKTFWDKTVIASGRGIEQSQRRFVNLHLLNSDEAIYRFIRRKDQPLGNT